MGHCVGNQPYCKMVEVANCFRRCLDFLSFWNTPSTLRCARSCRLARSASTTMASRRTGNRSRGIECSMPDEYSDDWRVRLADSPMYVC